MAKELERFVDGESKWIHARRKIKAKINSIPTARASWGGKGKKDFEEAIVEVENNPQI